MTNTGAELPSDFDGVSAPFLRRFVGGTDGILGVMIDKNGQA